METATKGIGQASKDPAFHYITNITINKNRSPQRQAPGIKSARSLGFGLLGLVIASTPVRESVRNSLLPDAQLLRKCRRIKQSTVAPLDHAHPSIDNLVPGDGRSVSHDPSQAGGESLPEYHGRERNLRRH